MKASLIPLVFSAVAGSCQVPPTELRTYTLTTTAAADQYAQIWQKHIVSLAGFNVTTRSVWRNEGDDKQVIAIVQYALGDDPVAVTEAYMASAAFAQDMEGFNMSSFASVIATELKPLAFSPVL
ncbi:hypothetical protein JX265_001098 [Neoarthrinium moseri]|uniref:NIPSNAP domain-containing protein n=1 Tax=Neoarthrinium moseri TaxID=1658444 RepID=A0A9P9WX19_9PEZI|nr:uncharacterized protein JN550_004630 [Neoarthrinium moseri]KAI1843805.1 hypothetical protein JX266_010064 [Neoarthrinium moseri]KAI1871185.1 hypothetical protein JN550_004630 [Neoarthrinium moseri]KAI1880858.1 hypothetical protein JX265_001098 [Neoarthrinium moseri]